MKRTIKLLGFAAVVAVFAVPASAQTKECNAEFQSATYSKWYDNRQKDQAAAYEAAKEYLAVCTTDDQYTAALKKFKAAYEAATADVTNRKQLDEAIQKKNYAEQMRLGKAILATEPDNVTVHLVMGVAGLADATLLSESAQYAKKAIELVGAGKPVTPLFTSKDQALAYLNYVLAKSVLKSDPAAAIPYLLKTARLESDLKKNPQLYLELAGAYGEGPVTKLSEAYRAKNYTVETPESKLEVANINQAIDGQIDALARAAALTTDAANKKAVMDVLTGLYTDRNKSVAGLDTLVANVLSKPLPDVPTPITSLPTTAPTAPVVGSQPPGSTGATQPAGTTGSTKPPTTPTPPKKPRANHRQG